MTETYLSMSLVYKCSDCSSVLGECRLLNVDFLELKGVLVQSIAAMQDREVLFKYALEEYTTARRNHIVRAYIDALTRGGYIYRILF